MDEGKKFSAADPWLARQLEKDLAINVLEDGEWGCYVRQVAHPLSAVDVRHAFVRLDNARERSTVRWEASQSPSAYVPHALTTVSYHTIAHRPIVKYYLSY